VGDVRGSDAGTFEQGHTGELGMRWSRRRWSGSCRWTGSSPAADLRSPNQKTDLDATTAVINADGGLSWEIPSTRPDDLYVHVVDQTTLNARIDELLLVG